MKEESLKKEAYQKPEIKSGSFDLGVYGDVGNYSPEEPGGCAVQLLQLTFDCGGPLDNGCLGVAQVEPHICGQT